MLCGGNVIDIIGSYGNLKGSRNEADAVAVAVKPNSEIAQVN